VIISDARVAPLHGRPLARRLRRAGLATRLVTFPAGERYKTRRTKERIEDDLLRLEVGRDAAVLAVGGGVTGDLAGFVAATWQRGIPLVQVPTSLVAMVDAALGGKTAVNLPGGKNLVGSFHHPWGVYADMEALATLPEAPFREGLAEVVKTAAIADARLFEWLEGSLAPVRARRAATIETMVTRCIRIKRGIVERDPHEAGRRAVLNFGHTVAHALERVSGFRLSHGAAVAIGLCVEAGIACERTGFPSGHADRLERLLDLMGLPTRLPPTLDPRAIAAATRSDKKRRRGRARYALPVRLGSALPGHDPTVEVDDRELLRALAALRR
jgi:3-dehydroquinate synthase